MKKLFKKFSVVEKSDMIITVTTIILVIFGIVMTISANMSDATNSTTALIIATIKELIFFFTSYIIMVVLSKIFNYRLARRTIMPLSIIITIMLCLTLFFEEVNGAQAWIRLGFGSFQFTLQPSEFAKVSTIVLIAMYFGDLRLNTNRSKKEIIRPVLWVVLVQAFIILVPQSDLGSAIVLVLIALFVSLIPSHPKLRKTQNMFIILTVVGFAGAMFIMSDLGISLIEKTGIFKGYQLARFTDYANPFLNISGSGYQLAGSLVAFSRGGLFGVGLGQSVQKYGYLPEARTDFILPLIAEELGFVGVMVLLLIYGLLLYRLTYYALKVKSERDKMILTGTVLYLFLHLLLNVGGVSVAIPLTGVPLLLISSGGSSTMAVMAAIGICQSIISKYRRSLEDADR